MDEQQLRRLKPELDQYLDRFAPLFGRDENRAHARRFVQGLLRGGDRRNIENIAEAMAGGPVRSLQAFLAAGAWSDREVLTELRRVALDALADPDAVLNGIAYDPATRRLFVTGKLWPAIFEIRVR